MALSSQRHSHVAFPQSRRKGFTLIELLVVIAIISLLVSILVPSLHKAKELANDLLCMTNLRTLGTGNALYTEDNDGEGVNTRNLDETRYGNYGRRNYPTSNYCYTNAYWAGKKGRYLCWGELFDGEYIGNDPRLFHPPCVHKNWTWDDFSPLWLGVSDGFGDRVAYGAYSLRDREDGSGRSVDMSGPTKAIGSDTLKYGGPHGGKYHVLFSNGSVLLLGSFKGYISSAEEMKLKWEWFDEEG